MKKDSIKNFAKKVLTVGFCVPVAFVCSAIPAMAADTASTGGGTASDTSVVEPQSTSTTGEAQIKESSKVVTPQAVPEKQPSVTETKTDNNNGTPEKTVKAASEEANDSTGTKETEQKAITAEDFLGKAINYGITAETFTLTGGDAETNVAAKTAECANQTGNDKTSESKKQEFIIGQVPKGKNFKIKGNSNTTVYCPETVNNSVQALGSVTINTVSTGSDTVHQAIDGLKKIVRVQSDACLKNAAQSDSLKATISYQSKDQKYHLDLPEGQQGTYYVTLDSSIFSDSNNPDGQNTVAKFRQDGSLLITAHEGQSIVFNVTKDFLKLEHTYTSQYDPTYKPLPENGFELTQFNWNNNGSGSYTNESSNNLLVTSVIWNLPDVEYLDIVGSIAGVIYAPKAEVHVKATSAGWIVADTVNIESGEWHNVSHYKFAPTTPEKIIEAASKIDDQSGDTVKPGEKKDDQSGDTVKPGEKKDDQSGDTVKPGEKKDDQSGDTVKPGEKKDDQSGDTVKPGEKKDDQSGDTVKPGEKKDDQSGDTVKPGEKKDDQSGDTVKPGEKKDDQSGDTVKPGEKKDDQSGDTVKPGEKKDDQSGDTVKPGEKKDDQSGDTVKPGEKKDDQSGDTVKPGEKKDDQSGDTVKPGNNDDQGSVIPSDNTPTITPTPTLPSENTGEKNNSQNTNPKTNDNQTTPGTNTGDQKGSTTQTKHNDAQDNHSAAGTDTAAGQTTGTQTVKVHVQNPKSTAPAVQRAAAQTSTTAASASAAKSTIPRTADETSLGTELILFGGAAAALAAALAVKRRKVSK